METFVPSKQRRATCDETLAVESQHPLHSTHQHGAKVERYAAQHCLLETVVNRWSSEKTNQARFARLSGVCSFRMNQRTVDLRVSRNTTRETAETTTTPQVFCERRKRKDGRNFAIQHQLRHAQHHSPAPASS